MNWKNLKTYDESPEKAFEILCNQLFERFLKREYGSSLKKYRVINGSGGDGGIEAYGELIDGNIFAIQSKYFINPLEDSQKKQIKNSIITAIKLRKKINQYFICIPRNINSVKIGKGKKPIEDFEEKRIDTLINEIKSQFPNLKLCWWFENEILTELQIPGNEGIHRYWFEKEVISIEFLKNNFNLQKNGWLKQRYISELHGNGIIYNEYNKVCFTKRYRKELYSNLYIVINEITLCKQLIDDFISTSNQKFLNKRLLVIKRNLNLFLSELQRINIGIKNGYDYVKPTKIKEVNVWRTKSILIDLSPTNLQKNILPKLISTLNTIHSYNLSEFIISYCNLFNQKIKIIFGDAGTGKTHGFSSIVENHIKNNMPALLIQAKGNYSNNWTDILSKSLELPNWTKQEILTALESCAIRNDIDKAKSLSPGKELNLETTKILICIDGLEEDIINQEGWCNHIKESEELVKKYPRLRFMFSARQYFNCSIPNSTCLDISNLPREGDISIHEVANNYFDTYDIELTNYSLIKGIDSLLALRLFCEKYEGKKVNDTIKILTATSDLLNDKVSRANDEFSKLLFPRKLSKARRPIFEALSVIAKYFYSKLTIEHNELCKLLEPTINYLEVSEIDELIEYLTNNGFLIKSERIINNDNLLHNYITEYQITYQSILENIISFDIMNDIKSGKLKKIPEILHSGMIRPLDYSPKKFSFTDISPNKKIIQDIVNSTFNTTKKLIGENNFLVDGFSKEEIFQMQMRAILQTSNELALEYKPMIDSLFFGTYKSRFNVLKYLIFPSSNDYNKTFGAEYLHNILINQSSPFERDKIWSGLDNFEQNNLNEEEHFFYSSYSPETIFDDLNIETIINSEQNYNEKPLFFAWALSSINQDLRKELKIKLTNWAIKRPYEFIKLLNKIFYCNDPQIQEDLASITLGIATKLKNKKAIKRLAIWSLKNIFSKTDIFRNIIIRQGFRAIVERAYILSQITKEDVIKSRPTLKKTYKLLKLDKDYLKSPKEEYYPIVNDLAWYVIEQAYNKFLLSPTVLDNKIVDNDSSEASFLLSQYRINGLCSRDFGMAAAISYIKSLGLNRVQGNGYTEATHGAKSKIFTYEEKYTWLAVHYLQGYLSDYMPMNSYSGEKKLISDYTQLSEVYNPAEDIIDFDIVYKDFDSGFCKDWIIKEPLISEIDVDNVQNSIKLSVENETNYNFSKWLNFPSKDFNIKKDNKKWIALYNRTILNDSQSMVYGWMRLEACLIKKDKIYNFIKSITFKPSGYEFISELDSLIAYPKYNSDCNPSDLIWMDWIEEENQGQEYFDAILGQKESLLNTIVDVNYFKMPSKKIRQFLKIDELSNNKFFNKENKMVSFIFNLEDKRMNDSQQIIVVDNELLKSEIEKNDFDIVWFGEIFKQKNPLNKKIKTKYIEQKTRKYFIWNENEEFKSIKIWDARFSNRKD